MPQRREGGSVQARGVPPPCRGAASAHRAMILDDWPLFAVPVGGLLVVGVVMFFKLM